MLHEAETQIEQLQKIQEPKLFFPLIEAFEPIEEQPKYEPIEAFEPIDAQQDELIEAFEVLEEEQPKHELIDAFETIEPCNELIEFEPCQRLAELAEKIFWQLLQMSYNIKKNWETGQDSTERTISLMVAEIAHEGLDWVRTYYEDFDDRDKDRYLSDPEFAFTLHYNSEEYYNDKFNEQLCFVQGLIVEITKLKVEIAQEQLITIKNYAMKCREALLKTRQQTLKVY